MQNERQEIITRRQNYKTEKGTVCGIIDVIKTLGQQALSLRDLRNEAVYSLDSKTDRQSNFLAMIQLMAKYDPVLASHVSKMQQNSAKRSAILKRKRRGSSQECGGLVAFLSKSTVHVKINIIKTLMQEQIISNKLLYNLLLSKLFYY